MSRILVIDDERAIRNTLKEVLEYEKHEVDLAEDGPSGLEMAIRKNYRKGAGAFYYKHIMNLDLYVCKMCYWGIIKPVLKGSYNLSHFKNIILGALCYIASKLPLRRM